MYYAYGWQAYTWPYAGKFRSLRVEWKKLLNIKVKVCKINMTDKKGDHERLCLKWLLRLGEKQVKPEKRWITKKIGMMNQRSC